MGRRNSNTKRGRKGKNRRPSYWSTLSDEARRRVLHVGLKVVASAALIAAGVFTIGRIEAQVVDELRSRGFADSTLVISDVPEVLRGIADTALIDALTPVLGDDWLDVGLCERLANRAEAVGWVRRVQAVRRRPDGRFDVRCEYRVPMAMVQSRGGFHLVDRQGVRLPGEYSYDARWMCIHGVSAAPPRPGEPWMGDDLQAGLDLIELVNRQDYRGQIEGVVVDNAQGRVDPRRSHIDLATDQPGGRIRWGSAPGREIEENSVAQKLRILDANFRTTGRIDANHLVIDVSTLPDRFLVVP
ncbi:MAG: hypothetical protein IIB55_07610 [Planctomycetes bacterium]|nr:hypothetical protein [Planctomycetota bacterium]